MPTETDLPDPRDLERARIAEDRGRPRGNAEWARRRIQDGAQVRKVIWPPGPFVEAGPTPNFLHFNGDGGEPQVVAQGAMFRADETEDDLWEHHPPAPAVPTMHAPILWILHLFPRLGGADVVHALITGLESGGSFAEHLIPIWAAAGDEATGRAIVAALAKIERATFHRSLIGDVKTSMEILAAVTGARAKGPTP